MIVNTIGSDLDLSKGLVSAALLKRAGRNMQDEIKRDPYAHGFEGDVIPTAGHLLNCKAVYHTVCAPKKYGPDQVGFLIYNYLSTLDIYNKLLISNLFNLFSLSSWVNFNRAIVTNENFFDARLTLSSSPSFFKFSLLNSGFL